jgi:xylan 1,4-beta-xylosidase
MDKEPLICLSYMPEVMSRSGRSRIEPPASYNEWGALVAATVAHLNVERKLGIRYWEVWNEPNQWNFWRGSYEEYLRLYDVTVRAAREVDSTIKVGGPALSSFEAGGLDDFMRHQAALGDGGRVDFISWHAYGQEPWQLERQIRKVKEIVGRYPRFSPELFITEFNVLQGGQGDTSIDEMSDKIEGAISLMRSIEVMQREGVDRAFLFELKDGEGPRRYWGRWGILTNDGQPKPVYNALRAYQSRPAEQLPVSVKTGATDGSMGVMAFGNAKRSIVLAWYTGYDTVRLKVAMPPEFSGVDYSVTLFDELHNNPARSGDATLRQSTARNAGDLVFTMKSNTLLILTSDNK